MNFIYVSKVCFFLSGQFPFIALLTLLTVTLVTVLFEKRRRKLVLSVSEEEQHIDLLQGKGIIDSGEALRLKQAANALPEVHEEYPLPDIHLRLTAALAKAYSLLKLVLLASNICIFYLIWQIKQSNPEVSYSMRSENLWLLILIYTLLSFGAIIQFAASTRITRGSRGSGRVLAGVWLFDLALLPLALIGASNVAYTCVAVFACAYSLWTLALRRNAVGYISFAAAATTNRGRTAVAVGFILCLGCGIFLVRSDAEYNYSFVSERTICRENIVYSKINNCTDLNRIAIIAATADDDSAALSNAICKRMKQALPELEFTFLPFHGSFPNGERKFDQFIFVSKARIIEKDKTENIKFPEAVKQALRKYPELTGSLSPVEIIPNAERNLFAPGENSLVFNVVLKDSFGCRDSGSMIRRSYLNFNSGDNMSGNILVAGDNSGGRRGAVIENCAKNVAVSLEKQFKKRLEESQVLKIPDFLLPELREISFADYGFLKNAWRVGNFRDVRFDNFSVMLFPLESDREKQQAVISWELENNGWIYHRDKGLRDQMIFTRTKNDYSLPSIVISMPLKPDNESIISGNPQVEEHFGYFVFAAGNDHAFDAEEAKRLKVIDLNSYVYCVRLDNLPQDELVQLTDRICNDSTTGFHMLKRIYDMISNKTSADFTDKKEKILIRMGEVLSRETDKSNFGTNVIAMGGLIKPAVVQPALEEHPAMSKISDRIIKVELNFDPDRKLYTAKEFTVPASHCPFIIEAVVPVEKQRRCLFVFSCKNISGDMNAIQVDAGTLPTAGVDNIPLSQTSSSSCRKGDVLGSQMSVNFAGGGSFSCSGLRLIAPWKNIQSGNMVLLYNYLVSKNLFEIQLFYRAK